MRAAANIAWSIWRGLILPLLKKGFNWEKVRAPEGQRFFGLMVCACIKSARLCDGIQCPEPIVDIRYAKIVAAIRFPNHLLGVPYARRFAAAISAGSYINRSSLALWPSGLPPVESFHGADQSPEPIQRRTSSRWCL
jgi:hypothetical protein